MPLRPWCRADGMRVSAATACENVGRPTGRQGHVAVVGCWQGEARKFASVSDKLGLEAIGSMRRCGRDSGHKVAKKGRTQSGRDARGKWRTDGRWREFRGGSRHDSSNEFRPCSDLPPPAMLAAVCSVDSAHFVWVATASYAGSACMQLEDSAQNNPGTTSGGVASGKRRPLCPDLGVASLLQS